MIFCPQCRYENRDHARFCAQCGAAVIESASDQARSRKSRKSYSSAPSDFPFGASDTGPLDEDEDVLYFDDAEDEEEPTNQRTRRSRHTRHTHHTRRARRMARRSPRGSFFGSSSKAARRRKTNHSNRARSARPSSSRSSYRSTQYDRDQRHGEDRGSQRSYNRPDGRTSSENRGGQRSYNRPDGRTNSENRWDQRSYNRPDGRTNSENRWDQRSYNGPDGRTNSENRWDQRSYNGHLDHTKNDRNRSNPYNRARSDGQGRGFTLSNLSMANVRNLSSDDYDDVAFTNGQPEQKTAVPRPFSKPTRSSRPFDRAYSRPSDQQEERSRDASWINPDTQMPHVSDDEGQAKPYQAVRKRSLWDDPPETEVVSVRREDEIEKTTATVVPNEPLSPSKQKMRVASLSTYQVITEPLSPIATELTPLPIGELLNKRRYVILSLLEQQTTQNLYLVQDRLHRQCGSCGATNNEKEALQCQTCGTEWLQEAIEQPRYLLYETFDQSRFEQQAAIVAAELRHPRVNPLLQAFSEQPFGPQARFCLLSEAHEGVSLASLSRPQPETQVLNWGRQVADGLIYLHGQGIAYRQLGLEQVIVVNGKAKLSDLSHVQNMPEYAPTIWQADEVDALGDMLFKLLDPLALSAPTTALFERFAHSQDRFLTMQAFADALDETLQQLQASVQVTHLVGQATHIGQQRVLNEDYLLTLKFEQAYLSENKPIGLYVVADGIGGQAAGDVASQLAVRTITQSITSNVMLQSLSGLYSNGEQAEPSSPDYATLLKEACLTANEVLHERRLEANNDMGTTIVAALVVDRHAYIANVGDSRAYFLRQGDIQQLTTDHSLVGRLLSLGQITPEQARTHPQRHVIYRTLGDKPQVEIDLFEQHVQPSDALILCTDGLYGMLKEPLIQQQVIQSSHPQAACEKLVFLANQAGGEDNMAVIVIKIEEVG